MATGIGASGKSVGAGDQITILGTVTAISGTGPTATVTVQPVSGGSTISVKASDCYAPQATGPATSINGKSFDVGSQVSIPAEVTSVGGSGNTATLTSKLYSGTSVAPPSKSVNHPHK